MSGVEVEREGGGIEFDVNVAVACSLFLSLDAIVITAPLALSFDDELGHV